MQDRKSCYIVQLSSSHLPSLHAEHFRITTGMQCILKAWSFYEHIFILITLLAKLLIGLSWRQCVIKQNSWEVYYSKVWNIQKDQASTYILYTYCIVCIFHTFDTVVFSRAKGTGDFLLDSDKFMCFKYYKY